MATRRSGVPGKRAGRGLDDSPGSIRFRNPWWLFLGRAILCGPLRSGIECLASKSRRGRAAQRRIHFSITRRQGRGLPIGPARSIDGGRSRSARMVFSAHQRKRPAMAGREGARATAGRVEHQSSPSLSKAGAVPAFFQEKNSDLCFSRRDSRDKAGHSAFMRVFAVPAA